MKKRMFAAALALVTLLSLAGCKSTLRPAIERYNRKYNVPELTASVLFDESKGFCYQGTEWGMTLKEFNEATDTSVSTILGFGSSNVTMYETDLYINLMGRFNDSASVGTVSVNQDSICYMLSFAYNSNKRSATQTVTEQILYTEYLPKLKEMFGEPSDFRETTTTQNNITSVNRTYYWDYEAPDETKTQLQWAGAYVSGSEEPTLVTLGIVWFTDYLEEADESKAE
ncbi:MAG: hypothetical protein IKR59_02795 [Lachnospiraceae bacterium]|nr:hypothetical protein [Lachnospiraceae bacterium]